MTENLKTSSRNNNSIFIYASLSALAIYIYPIISNDFYYIDDLGRVIQGLPTWRGNGRPFAEYLFQFLTGNFAVDIHPLPLILGCSSIIYAGWKYYKLFFYKSPYVAAAALMAVLANPFLLENLSYRYESMMMCISLSLASLSAIQLYKANLWRFLASIILLFFMFCFYQASISVFLVFMVAVQAHRIIQKDSAHNTVKNYTPIIFSIASILISFSLYKLIYGDLTQLNEYDRIHSQVISFTSEGLHTFQLNVEKYYSLINLLFNGHNGTFYEIFILCGFISSIFIAYGMIKDKRYVDSVFILFTPFLAIALSITALCILQNAIVVPRTLLGISGTLFFFFYIIFIGFKSKICLTIFFPVLITSTTICYAYSNTLKSQQEQEQEIISQVAKVITERKISSNHLAIIGREPISNKGRKAIETFPIIDSLVPRVINNRWIWGYTLFKHHPDTIHLLQSPEVISHIPNGSELIIEHRIFRLWNHQSTLILQIK